MKYSIVNNQRVEPFSGGKGICICCQQPTIAKCGTIKIRHWAHKSLHSCDHWWENETPWHRSWKDQFPPSWQEVVHFDDHTGEKHVADIKTANGIVIEFQNSPISIEELMSRESFYKRMVWVVNTTGFNGQLTSLQRLPDPKAGFMKDIVLGRVKDNLIKEFLRYSDVLVHSITEIQDEIDQHYIGHHLFHWNNSRSVWYQAGCDVFYDAGGPEIWKLIKYDKRGLGALKKIDKEYFIKRALF